MYKVILITIIVAMHVVTVYSVLDINQEVILKNVFHIQNMNIIIQPIQPSHIQEARTIILQRTLDLQIVPCADMPELEAYVMQTGALNDLCNISSTYTQKQGAFLVIPAIYLH